MTDSSLTLFTDKAITSVDLVADKTQPRSEGFNSGVAGQVAHINSVIDPDIPLYEHFLNAKNSLSSTDNQTDYIKGVVNSYREYNNNIIREAAGEDIDNGEDVLETLDIADELFNVSGELLSDTYGLEAANVMAAGGSSLEAATLEQAFYTRQISELADGIGTFEMIKDLGMMMFPTVGVDLAELTGGNVLTSYEDFKTLARNFWSKDRETRLRIFPSLVSDVFDASETLGIDNKTKAVSIIATLFDPNRESQLDLENVLEKADWALIAAPLVLGVARTVKGFGAIKNVSRAGDNATAASANNAAMGDGSVADSLKQDQVVAGANAGPFEYEAVLPEATDGLSKESMKAVDETLRQRSRTQVPLEEAMAENNLLKIASLTEKEQVVVQEKFLSNLDELKEEVFRESGYYLTDATVGNKTDKGFSINYLLDGVDAAQDIEYKWNDVGEFDYNVAGAIETYAASPEVWMNKILKGSVEDATIIGFAQHKLLGQLQTSVKEALSGVSRKERKKIDSILLAGDAWDDGVGKVFSVEELLGGVNVGDELVKLSPKGVGSYFAQRDVLDATHYLKNIQVRDDLDFHGWKAGDIGIETGLGKEAIIKPYAKTSSIPPETLADFKRNGFTILDTRANGTVVTTKDLDLTKLYDSGSQVVKLRSPTLHGTREYDYAIVNTTSVKELPATVLNKKVGYVPKISEDGWFWVKKQEGVTRNGISGVPKTSTMRAFDSMRDAQKYSDELNLTAKEGVKYEPKKDRDLTISERNDEIISEAGGLWTGSRSSREIKFGLGEGTELKRISAYDAMQRNLQHISTQSPMNEWRMGMIQRWSNTAKKYMLNPERDMARGLDAPIPNAAVGSKEEVALNASREWIRDQLRIPTEAEQRWNNATGRLGEWMEGKPVLDTSVGSINLRRGLMHISSKDPYSAMRGAAFHTLLGWFNPAQLFVQAQGASIAFALDPLAAPARVAKYTAVRAAYHVRRNPSAVAKTAKASGMSPKELQEIVDQLDKTGLMESIKSTADYNASAQGFGITRDAISRWADRGLVLYNEGERFSRGYSFLTARSQWLKANPGKSIDDAAIKDILERTTQLTLNFSRANRAGWQKGGLSLVGQFKQPTTKFIEAMLPNVMKGATGNFTGGEKARIIAGQLFLYGGAGVPLGTWVVSEMAEAAGYDPTTVSDEWKAAATDGFWGYVQEEMFGEHFSTGDRGAYASGIEQFYEDLFLREVPVSEMALGAFHTVPTRVLNAIGKIAPLVTNPSTYNYTADEFIKAGLGVTDVFSSFSNAHKGYMIYKYGELRDSNGKLVASVDEDNAFVTAIGQGLGFAPARLTEHYSRMQWLAHKEEFKKEKRDGYRKLMLDYLRPGRTFDEKAQANFKLEKIRLFVGFNENETREVVESVNKDVWSGNTAEDKLIKQVLQSWYTSDDINQGKETLMFNKEIGGE